MYVKSIFILVLTILMTSCLGKSNTNVQKNETNQKTAKQFIVGKGGDVGGGFGNPVNSEAGVNEKSGRQ